MRIILSLAVASLILAPPAHAGLFTKVKSVIRYRVLLLGKDKALEDMRVRKRESAEKLQKALPKILAEEAAISRLAALIPAPGFSIDAGPFLNPRLEWEGNDPTLAEWRELKSKEPGFQAIGKALPEDIREQMRQAFQDMRKGSFAKAEALPLEKLDFSWMSELEKFDHWNILPESPLAWKREDRNPLSDSSPNYATLTLWANLRRIKGIREGKPEEGFRVARKVAQLLVSTETLIGAAAGVRLAAFEEFFLPFVSREKIQPLGDLVGRQADAESFARQLSLRSGLYRPLVDASTRRRIMERAPAWMRCTAVNEGLFRITFERDFMQREFPAEFSELETDVRSAHANCRPSLAWRRWEKPIEFSELILLVHRSDARFAPSASRPTEEEMRELLADPKTRAGIELEMAITASSMEVNFLSNYQ